MTVAVDLGSGAVKLVDGADSPVISQHSVDPELAARVGTRVPLYRRVGGLVIAQAPHDAYVRSVAMALDGMAAESVAIVVPDWWSKRARDTMQQTFDAHASGPFQLVSPAVAAIRATRNRQALPTTVAVLDIGAESSSATVISSADGVPHVVGRPGVLHGQAGNDIDRRLMQHVLGWLRADGHIFEPADSEITSAGESLLRQVKAAKERLSTSPAATLKPDLPDANAELRLVRSEFDEVVRETVDSIVAMLRAAIGTNDMGDVETVLLIGGSVSIPLVTQVISVELGLPVVLDSEPATLAVRGAATVEIAAPPQQKMWRRRKSLHAARNVFDLDNAPTPESESVLDSSLSPGPGPGDEPPVEAQAADADVVIPDLARQKVSGGNEPACDDPACRLFSLNELTGRGGVATWRVPPWEPIRLVIETSEGAAGRRLTARWSLEPEPSEWNNARHASIDAEGQFRLRVNGLLHKVDMGKALASRSVTVLLIGLQVFVTASESGELLRELRLNPDQEFRPE